MKEQNISELKSLNWLKLVQQETYSDLMIDAFVGVLLGQIDPNFDI